MASNEEGQRSNPSDWDSAGKAKKGDDWASSMAKNPPFLLLVCSLVCGILGACIAYLVFGIIFLVSDENVCGNSDQRSNLWVYALVVIAGSFGFSCCTNLCLASSNPTDINIMKLRIALAISWMAAMVIYGCYVLYVEGICDNLKNTGLYVWVQVSIFFQLIVATICIFIFWIYWDKIVAMVAKAAKEDEILAAAERAEGDAAKAEMGDEEAPATPPSEETPLIPKTKEPEASAAPAVPERDPSQELD